MHFIQFSFATLAGLCFITTASAAPEYPLFGDINGDCIVDKRDIKTIYGVAMGQKVRVPYNTDLNNDGVTNYYDYYLVIGASTSTCGRRLIGDVNGDGIVNTADTLDILAGFGDVGSSALDINRDQLVNNIDLDMVSAQLGDTLGRRVLGDVNGDYIVSSSDVLEALTLVGSTTNAADLNRDGTVTSADLNALQSQLGETACSQMPGDANGDRLVDVYDIILVAVSIGTSLTQFDCNQDGVVSEADYDIVVDNQALTAAQFFEGDINGDWMVSDADVELIEATLGTYWPQADIDENGTVEIADLLDINALYGNTTASELDGDIDNNCAVDIQDLSLAAAFMGDAFAPGDTNNDDTINITDILVIIGNQGTTCD